MGREKIEYNKLHKELAEAKYFEGEQDKNYFIFDNFPATKQEILLYDDQVVPDVELVCSAGFIAFSDRLERIFSRFNKKGIKNIHSKRLIQLQNEIEKIGKTFSEIDLEYSFGLQFPSHPNFAKSENYRNLINDYIGGELDRRILSVK